MKTKPSTSETAFQKPKFSTKADPVLADSLNEQLDALCVSKGTLSNFSQELNDVINSLPKLEGHANTVKSLQQTTSFLCDLIKKDPQSSQTAFNFSRDPKLEGVPEQCKPAMKAIQNLVDATNNYLNVFDPNCVSEVEVTQNLDGAKRYSQISEKLIGQISQNITGNLSAKISELAQEKPAKGGKKADVSSHLATVTEMRELVKQMPQSPNDQNGRNLKDMMMNLDVLAQTNSKNNPNELKSATNYSLKAITCYAESLMAENPQERKTKMQDCTKSNILCATTLTDLQTKISINGAKSPSLSQKFLENSGLNNPDFEMTINPILQALGKSIKPNSADASSKSEPETKWREQLSSKPSPTTTERT
jgi:hypothetical protein